jgi:HEAT repeat protein
MTSDQIEAMTVDELAAALGDPRPSVRRRALAALRRRPPEAAFAALLAGLSHPRAMVQRRAAEALGEWGDHRAVEPLMGLLRGTTVNVRLAVIQSLAQLGDVRALPALRRLARFWRFDDLGFSLEGIARIREAARQAVQQWDRLILPPDTALSRAQPPAPATPTAASLSRAAQPPELPTLPRDTA